MQLGHSVAVALWVMTALSFTLVTLRLYTRIRLVHFFAIEDHLYLWTGIWLLAFTISIQVAIHYGLGRSFWTLSLDDSANAIFWTYVATTLSVTGNAFAKFSMGFFLLRVVPLKSHKVAVWLLLFITAATSIALPIMLWNQTTPVQASWDVLRTPGTWNFNIQPFAVGLGAWSSACDFFFAAFPWLFVWFLHISRRDKIILAGGMGLGVIAGACGIVRTVVLSKSAIDDYTLGFAEYYVWAGAEISVALVCLAIPTLRPLSTKRHGRSTNGYERTDGYERRRTPRHSDPELAQFAMCEPKGPAPPTLPLPALPRVHVP
ncbi:hypothetical protein C8A00DRAFT_16116 [Chaetomidium leptoderma]|uniref:Rhodopsin domain-containing protein n=1 Tax=Chaetomidium leptoderma TaxID=669021 RepID=A0AAN6VLJ9_9PEZI|nr:hypothetical protein C8A00DRAFT_16116 [Chaetomidium leptoderma]